SMEKMVLPLGFIALAEESDVLVAEHEAHVGYAPDEVLGAVDDTMDNQVGPKFFGELKSLCDLDGFADSYRSISPLRCIIQLTQGGMARTGVVPCIGAFS